MLHYETITEETLAILKHAQSRPLFKTHRLVGGTALALLYGHRISVDLDFFGSTATSFDEIVKELESFGKIELLKNSSAIKVLVINNIKLDIVHYNYSWIEEPVKEDGLLLASAKDIAAMKIAAITGRGSKKDFFDLALLLKHFSLTEIFNFFILKYPDASIYLALKSLIYFDDADEQPDPVLFDKTSWKEVKRIIETEQVNYLTSIGG